LDSEIINNIFHNVSSSAGSLNYQILPDNPFQLLQCPTSFIAQNFEVNIFLHIPITSPNAAKLTIYKYIPLPFHIDNRPAIITRPNRPYIAINSIQHTFFTMDANQFRECRPVGKLFVCYNQITHNHPNTQNLHNATIPRQDACLFALFLQHADTASSICDTFPAHLDPPQLHQVHADQVLLHSFEPTLTTITCPNGAHTDLHSNQPTIVTIPPSCKLSTPYSSFTATINLDRSFHHKIYTWPHDPIRFLSPLQSSIALQSLQSKIPLLHPATNLKLWAQDSQHNDYLYVWNCCNSVIIILIIIFLSCYFVRLPILIARNISDPAKIVPSAPPPSPGLYAHRQGTMMLPMTSRP